MASSLTLHCSDNKSRGGKRPTQEIPQYVRVALDRVFVSTAEDETFFSSHRFRLRHFGSHVQQKRHNTVQMGRTVAIQYTSRKRLYDHNLTLRGLFAGKIVHRRQGNLGPRFRGALFFDLGSAILRYEGAPTVRDIHEDPQVRPFLGGIVASDINDYRSKKTEFINIYRRSAKQLPFPVQEIPLSIDSRVKVLTMQRGHLASMRQPLILRTANTGIDFYYTEQTLRKHLAALAGANPHRDLIYIFNKFLLYKPAESHAFQILGQMDDRVFTVELSGGVKWRYINWNRRTFAQAIKLSSRHVLSAGAKP